jgi:hypothetical protein
VSKIKKVLRPRYIFVPLLLFVLVVGLLILRARQKSQVVFAAYDVYAQQVLNEQFTLNSVPVPDVYQTVHPWKTLKLIKMRAENFQTDELAHITMLNTDILGFMKMYTLLIRPDYGYNLPIMSVDVMIMGGNRMYYIEFIDPTGVPDAALDSYYDSLGVWQAKLQQMEQRPITEWQKPLLHPYSIHIQSDASHDVWLQEVFQAYLDAYLAMVRAAEPVDAATSTKVQAGIEGYVTRLLNEGGPAVDTFKMLVGDEGQQVFVRQVMFGVDAP